MVARVAVVFAGLVAYRLMGDDHLLAGALAWLGVIVTGFVLIDHFTLGRGTRMEKRKVGFVALGVGLVGTAVALRVT